MRTALEHVWVPSPSFNDRPEDVKLDMLVLHYTGMADCGAAIERLKDPEAKVSCHYVVDLDGAIVQMVGEEHRAWHAGRSFWRGVRDNNGRSIGIEIQNKDHTDGYHDFPDDQMNAVVELSQDILSRHDIPAHNIVAHSDIAPGRKIDPGEKFNWKRLYDCGIGHWVAPVPVRSGQFFQQGDQGEPVSALQAMLGAYGFDLEITGDFNKVTQDVVFAFQQHWRQAKVDGIADVSTIETLHKLIQGLPGSPLQTDSG